MRAEYGVCTVHNFKSSHIPAEHFFLTGEWVTGAWNERETSFGESESGKHLHRDCKSVSSKPSYGN